MKRSKRDPARDEFEAFLASPTPNRHPCETCSSGGVPAELLLLYATNYRDGKTKHSAKDIHKFLANRHGYSVCYSAMTRHLRVCLGHTPRVR